MPAHLVKTVDVEYQPEEKPDMQWKHRAAAR